MDNHQLSQSSEWLPGVQLRHLRTNCTVNISTELFIVLSLGTVSQSFASHLQILAIVELSGISPIVGHYPINKLKSKTTF